MGRRDTTAAGEVGLDRPAARRPAVGPWYERGVASDPARSRDPEYPDLPAEVIGAYRDPPPGMVVEVVDGLVYTMTRPRPIHQRVGASCTASCATPSTAGAAVPAAGFCSRSPS